MIEEMEIPHRYEFGPTATALVIGGNSYHVLHQPLMPVRSIGLFSDLWFIDLGKAVVMETRADAARKISLKIEAIVNTSHCC